MTDEEIIIQLRKLRAAERVKLDNQLLPEYHEGLANALSNINETIKDTNAKYNDACEKYMDIKDKKFINKTSKQDAYKLYLDLSNELEKSKHKKIDITNTYYASSRRTVKLNEFDIETEQMILAHMCQVELICGNKKVLPMIES